MVKVPALAGAEQAATAPLVQLPSVQLASSITTVPLLPPVQVTVSPLERVAEPLITGLTRVGDAGMVKVPLNEPTFAPPVPVTVSTPGTRKFPGLNSFELLFSGRDTLPFGPVSLTVGPASRLATLVTGVSVFSLRLL